MSNIIDNLERIGHKQAGDVTTIPSYTPDQEVGPQTDFARDFHAESKTTGPLTDPNLKSQVPASPVSNGENVTDLEEQTSNVTMGALDNPTWMREAPAPNFATGQFQLSGNGGVQIAQARSDRRSMVVMNIDATNNAYIGPNSAVNPTSGFVLVPGGAITLAVASDVWAVGSGIVTVIEYLGA